MSQNTYTFQSSFLHILNSKKKYFYNDFDLIDQFASQDQTVFNILSL